MAVLYDRSVTWRGLVVGTGNKTESLIGYTTLFGDNACAFNPIGDLYKSQVRQLAAAIGVPDAIVRQGAVGRPVAGPDRRERGRLQLSGARPPAVLADRQAPLDRGARRRRASPAEPVERVDRVGRRRRVQAPGPADRQARAADRRRRLPLPAPSSGSPVGRRRPQSLDGDGRRDALRRRDADRQPRRRHRSGRIEVLRAVPLIAAEDTRITRRLLDRYGDRDADGRASTRGAVRAAHADAARPPAVPAATWRS